ncbi:MAG: hypothetical protein IPH82_20650 [Chloroflexi bacterium]|nr:hypothetical protein [Chloroflexota bacterium]
MLGLLLIVSLSGIVVILFRPRRSPYVRRITGTRNGRPWWKDNEPY